MWQKIPKNLLLKAVNLWPPFVGAGIRLKTLTADFRFARVEMKLTTLNTNYVGVHFGGSLYSMTDPWYMLMVMDNLGREYVVWDKAARIQFKRPGKGLVHAEFTVTESLIEEIKSEVLEKGKTEKELQVEVKNSEGQIVALVDKTIWISKKKK